MKTYIEISKTNLIHNLNLFRERTGKALMFVVKANAYGHGLREIVGIAKGLPYIDYYAVDSAEEALAVKKIDETKKILVIGWCDDEELESLLVNGIEMIAPSLDFLARAESLAKKTGCRARVHLKIETGTSRLGMPPAQAVDVFSGGKFKFIEITGLYSHFANIEDTTDHSYALQQLNVFNDLLDRLKKEGLNHGSIIKHFSCSAAALLFPKTYFDIVRVGISAYGYWPSKETYISHIEQHGERIDLRPVLSWRTKVAQVKHLDTGDFIGYGITYRTFNKTRLVVVPVGYYDGYGRKLSNVSTIIINGVKAPVRGRVCMDMFMAEVTHIKDVKEGDTITLLGTDKNESINADYLAELSGTINYEFLGRLNPLIPRVVVD